MKRKILINSIIFAAIDSLICILTGNYSYFSIIEMFNFYSKSGYINLTLLIFYVSFISTIIITINGLVEERIQIAKYIKTRSNKKKTVYMHFLKLFKDISLIAFSSHFL